MFTNFFISSLQNFYAYLCDSNVNDKLLYSDEPGKPGRPEPTNWDNDHVDLKWTAPDSDGGASITGYIIEKRKKGTYKWHKAAETRGPGTSGTAPDLEEREEYEFRVIAVNKAGPSEPSEPSKSVIAKPRSCEYF